MSDAPNPPMEITMVLKVPEEVRDTMVAVAALLRSDAAFLPRLQLFVDEYQRPSLAAAFEKVLGRLESLETHVIGLSKDIRAVQTRVGNGDLPEWITGQGNRIRLTPRGEEEVDRLLQEGLSDTDISIRIGVSGFTVSKKRRQLDRKLFENSLRSER